MKYHRLYGDILGYPNLKLKIGGNYLHRDPSKLKKIGV